MESYGNKWLWNMHNQLLHEIFKNIVNKYNIWKPVLSFFYIYNGI